MRQVGTIAAEREAQRFADYLLTLGIGSRVDTGTAGHSVWVFEENDVERAKAAFDEFVGQPDLPKFTEAQQAAAKLRAEQAETKRKAQGQVIELRDRWQAPGRNSHPLTVLLVGVSIGVTLLGGHLGTMDRQSNVERWLEISAGGPFLHEVLDGQVWRLVTPIFLHFGLPHLVFDMYWLYVLGALIEARRGTLVLLALVLVSAVSSNLGQYLDTGPRFGGMSGVDYALFGYAWMQSRFNPRGGIFIPPYTAFLMLGWLVVCMLGLTGDVANTAHLVGLAVGIASGCAPLWLKRF
jgi:GlpG protein